MKQKHLVIVGGGAAGFFTAVNAAAMSPGIKVTLLEKTGKLLSKVRVSGGGRCNVTHACFDIAEMSKRYPRGGNFLKKAFHHFFTRDTIDWFEQRGVKLKTEQDGRMFPQSNSSETIVECLIREANRFGVEIKMNTEVKDILKNNENGRFNISSADGAQLIADWVCIACGGFPKLSRFLWLRQLGHTIVEPVPSLFTFNMPGNAITHLMGISVEEAQVKVAGTRLEEKGPLLITHWGLSGPVILRLSAWGARILAEKNYAFDIHVNWLPAYTEHSLREAWNAIRLRHAGGSLGGRNTFGLPARLWEYLLQQSGIPASQRWDELQAKQQNSLILHLTAQKFSVKGKTTFKEEFVTAGGIYLPEIDVNTMQSRKHTGLFFAGEILDVDGITGGFNFQHAWTSGWIAASGIGKLAQSACGS
ncbi:MAG: NAD(P)/FAD-dependent oxidoreductase [Chitinophagaceae bacterium]|nr:NAD(P)/FAD-dependent oxidoreductase [Chitinophagaceae bacterium]